MFGKLRAGQVSTADILWEMAFATPEKAMNSMRPDLKALYEVPTETSLFPEPFQPRSQRRGETIAATFGLQDEYKWMKGWVLEDGGTARPHYWQRMAMGVVDPRQSALSQMYDLRTDFLRKKGQEQKGIFPVSRYKEAREAAKFEDYDAFVDWKRKFVKKEGDDAKDNFKDWLRTLDPIANRLNDEDEREFEEDFLTSEQRGRLTVARNYSHELRDLLVSWWDADDKSAEMKTAVAYSAFARMDVSSPPIRGKYKTIEEYRTAATKYERQNQSAARDILSMASSPKEAKQLLLDWYNRPGESVLTEGGEFKQSYERRKARINEIYGVSP